MDSKSKCNLIHKDDHHTQKILKTHIVVENSPENHIKAKPDIADGQVQQSNESVTASTVLTPISQRVERDLNCTDDNDIKAMNDTSSAEYASYMPIVIAWNSDPTIPVSYYWNNVESSLCMDKATLAEDDKSSTNYLSCHL